MSLPLACPLLGTWPATQECSLTGNRTNNPLVFRPVLNPLSHTSQRLSRKYLNSMYQSARAVKTKCHTLYGLNNRHLFLNRSGAWKVQDQGQLVDWVFSKDSVPGSRTATFSLYPHMVEKKWMGISQESYNYTMCGTTICVIALFGNDGSWTCRC